MSVSAPTTLIFPDESIIEEYLNQHPNICSSDFIIENKISTIAAKTFANKIERETGLLHKSTLMLYDHNLVCKLEKEAITPTALTLYGALMDCAKKTIYSKKEHSSTNEVVASFLESIKEKSRVKIKVLTKNDSEVYVFTYSGMKDSHKQTLWNPHMLNGYKDIDMKKGFHSIDVTNILSIEILEHE